MSRRPPAVHYLLEALKDEVAHLGRETVKRVIRDHLAHTRVSGGPFPETQELLQQLRAKLAPLSRASYPAVINATGVLIHTNLGRTPRLQVGAASYLALEMQLETGERGERLAPVRDKLCRYFGAEDALVVTNNAAALLLLLAACARGKEVVVSRGELIEIGGSFRLPEIMAEAGATLVEVGCTNRTHLRDYQKAIGPQTAALLQVHRSNFAMTGFVATPEPETLARVAHETGVMFWVDQGSGCHTDLRPYGLHPEPTVQELLAAGADVVLFSGDKLLGGPQAGILLGKRRALEPLRHHPLRRALRPDKAALVSLAATLDCYLTGQKEQVPLYALLGQDAASLRRRARRLARQLTAHGVPATALASHAVLGGGTTPGQKLPSWAVGLPDNPAVARALRLGTPPVIPRQEAGKLLLDLKAVFPEQDQELAAAVVRAWNYEST